MPDPDLELRRVGGGGGGGNVPKKFFRVGLKTRKGAGPPGPSPGSATA